ncbi:cortex morphogenetic protein CmpA [Salipaludibacillus neizhouensis]|uniref:Cortex morphogenetic protein CmpA n=1 Tax=Salipaludibacillus neizhouensis TaxID=885475 RepID=A0A3A9K472_9BACI|nr:cortex morphogenetic protein CmpA [Salipaludibacillus neizhouensis]RKL65091.1 cortex morphogenetic protein CmpA [Salipaludibacillus neizhouensis]
MPSWLKRQLLEAYAKKDFRKVKTLNQCWFYYKNLHYPGEQDKKSSY